VPLVVGSTFHWAYPGYLLLLALLGGISAGFGWGVHILHVGRRVPLGLAVPLAWVAGEWIKAHAPFGLAFPWLGLGVALTGSPDFLGIAEWVGERGVAFWIAGVNGFLAAGLISSNGSRGIRHLVLGGAMVAVPAGIGGWRARSLPLEDGPTVVAVGTNVPRALRAQPDSAARVALGQIRGFVSTGGLEGADLVVLPEATLPLPMEEARSKGFLRQLAVLATEMDAPLVFGGLGRDVRSGSHGEITNSAYVLVSGTLLGERYDKSRLVPAMEAGRYARGGDPGVLVAGPWIVGPLICYESLFGDLARTHRQSEAEVLLNLSSDVWFGGAADAVGSAFLQQHPAHLVLRAVENRMPVARAANGGLTLLLDPLGRRVGEVVPPEGGWVRGALPVFRSRTFFCRSGDWVGPACLLASILLIFAPSVVRIPPTRGEFLPRPPPS